MANQPSQTPQQNIDWADTEIAKYRARIADLEAYKRVERAKIPGLFDVIQRGPQAPLWRSFPEAWRQKADNPRYAVRFPNGMRTVDIVTECAKRGLVGSPCKTLYAELSEYGKQGLVLLDGGFWIITQKGRDYLAQKI